MSSNGDAIDRYNKYKSRMDDAATQVIRRFLHLVRPTEGFPCCSAYEIQTYYNQWKDDEDCFYRMTGSDMAPQRIFPKPPADDAPRSCWRMWGLLIQQQVERIDQSDLISNCVSDILASPRCQGECPCKVSTNPWTSYHEVAALEVLNVAHNPRCQCLGYQRCVKKESAAMAAAAAAASIKASEAAAAAMKEAEAAKAMSGGFPYSFCQCGDTQYRACSCGKPAKEAVEYAKKLDSQGKLTPELGEMLCGKGWTKAVPEDEDEDEEEEDEDEEIQRSYYNQWKHEDEDEDEEEEDEDEEIQRSYYNQWKHEDEDERRKKPTVPGVCAECEDSFRGQCVECHVKMHAYDERGRLAMPSVLHLLRQGYYMGEEYYANSMSKAKERRRAHEAAEAAEAEAAEAAEDAKAEAAEAAEDAKAAEAKTKHVPNCACGVCFWAREAKEGRYPPKSPPRAAAAEPTPSPIGAILQTAKRVDAVINKALVTSGGSGDIAKDIFAVMGTPFDSTCPHGLPFYSCMPCSH